MKRYIYIKSHENYKRKLLLCVPQLAKTQSTFCTAIFHNKRTLCHIKSNICI